ncbi:hypothetical protein [Microscilla marina]|uniref:Uncharacterized protein n=1 Tax=Microscilla marina ATCC 23134 TaxID=313606 RepID=A1ZIQ6_MICM2|nr:hypothetical protein [Microscilla marina]EAY29924.1 hypothetical protein M23134_05797 [Microscilla marina ATCC 23134]
MSQPAEGDEFSHHCFHCDQKSTQHYLYSEKEQVEFEGDTVEIIDSFYLCLLCGQVNKIEDI